MSKNFIDRFYEEDSKSQFWSLNKKIGASLIVLFLAVIMINTSGCTPSQSTEKAEDVNTSVDDIVQQDTVKIGDDGVNAAIAGENVGDVTIVSKQDSSNKMVAMAVEDMGRNDPFLPDAATANAPKPKPPSYLMAPPETITEDPDAIAVIQTKVSGIMYDKSNPSAILNVNGADHLVRSGDIINNYKILAISPDNVTVQLGYNIYKAGVGQLFTGEGINYNTVSNLEGKFGGAKNTANRRN